jgi:hypothetical protein
VTKALGRRELIFNQMKIIKDEHGNTKIILGKPFIKFFGDENFRLAA